MIIRKPSLQKWLDLNWVVNKPFCQSFYPLPKCVNYDIVDMIKITVVKLFKLANFRDRIVDTEIC